MTDTVKSWQGMIILSARSKLVEQDDLIVQATNCQKLSETYV